MRVDNKQLPVGWTVSTIEDIADVNPRINKAGISDALNVSFVPMPAVGAADGSIDVSGERLFGEVKKGFTPFQEGDVLFAKITPCMENGKMAIVPKLKNDLGFGSTEFHVLRPREGIDARYIYYYVSSKNFRGEAERYMTGAVGQRRVTTPYLKECEIPLPPPEQQKRIVAEIEKQFSRLDEAVTNLKRVKANLKRYKAAVLKAAVEGKLTEEWRKQHPDVEPASKLLERVTEKRNEWIKVESAKGNNEAKRLSSKLKKHRFKTPENIKLPEKWKWASFVTASQLVVDCHNKTAPYEENGISLVRTTNVRDGKLDLETVKYVSRETYEYWSRRCPPGPGDILFTREAPMGEAAIVPDGANVCMGQRMMLIRLFPEFLNNKYFLYTILEPNFQSSFSEGAVGMGVKHLRVGDVESLVIPIPPVQEQIQIVKEVESRLSVAEEVQNETENNLQRAERLRQSILSKAFSGGLFWGEM